MPSISVFDILAKRDSGQYSLTCATHFIRLRALSAAVSFDVRWGTGRFGVGTAWRFGGELGEAEDLFRLVDVDGSGGSMCIRLESDSSVSRGAFE